MSDAYPLFDKVLSLATEETAEDDIQIDRAINGIGRARVFYTEPKRTWEIVQADISSQQRAQLDTFYRNHRGVVVTLVVDDVGTLASVLMVERPRFKARGRGRHTAVQRVVEFP